MIGFGGLLTGDDFLYKAVELAQLCRALAEERAHLFGAVDDEQHRNRHRDHKHQNQRRRDAQHHNKGADDGDGTGCNLKQVVGQRGVDCINIIGKAADDVSGLVAVKKAHRQLQQLIHQIFTHLINNLLADFDHQHRQQVAQSRRKHIEHQHQTAVKQHQIEVGLPRSDADGIDGIAGQHRSQQSQQVAGNGQADRCQHHPLVLQQIFSKPQDDLFAVPWFMLIRVVWYHPKSPPI